MRKDTLFPVLLAGLPLAGFCNLNQQQAEKPNIVIILADDLGTHELSCYGGQNLQTPNIDRIANEGVRFSNSYASCAMSVPLRASLFTGLYPVRHGSFQNHKKTYSNIKSVGHYLPELGYRVGRTGKDHPVNQPTVYPFETIPGWTVGATAQNATHTTAGIEEFIKRSNDPFCLYVCSVNSHTPWSSGNPNEFNLDDIVMPPNSVDNATTRSIYRKYLAEIRLLDNEVGSVLNVLEQSNKLDNTLVIFLGEQGPQMPFGKWTCYRYGQNSAFVARYPAKIQQGTINDALIQYEDILPTMIEFAGGNPIEGLDGSSFLDVLFREKTDHRQWAYGIHNNLPEGTAYPIRSIQNKKYRLIVNLTPDVNYFEKHMMNLTRTDQFWTHWVESAKTNDFSEFLVNRFERRPEYELYDVESDPWELNNLMLDSEFMSQQENIDRIALMKAELQNWMIAQGDRGITMDVENPESPIWSKTPVNVSTYEDLQKIREDLNGFYFFKNDIVIPEGTEWLPIGATSTATTTPDLFTGIIDGNGHVIRNLKISNGNNFTGFIGRLTHGGMVMNLGLENVDIRGKTPTGGLAGSIFEGVTIDKVYVTGSVKGENEVGGLIGRSNNVPENKITDSFVNATISSIPTGNTAYAGGLIGIINGKTVSINNSYAAGSIQVTPSNTRTFFAGGLIGAINNNTTGASIQATSSMVGVDNIAGGTPNLLVGGVLQSTTLSSQKVYARNDISLVYADPTNKGGGDGLVKSGMLLSPTTFLTRDFYETELGWDLESVWDMEQGSYPVLNSVTTSLAVSEDSELYKAYSQARNIVIETSAMLKVKVADLSGKLIYRDDVVSGITIPVQEGFYVLMLDSGRSKSAMKVLVQ